MKCHLPLLVTVCLGALTAVSSAQGTAKATLQNGQGQNIGTAELIQLPNGVLFKLSVKGIPAGEHAFHVHAVGKCEPPFTTAGGHFNPNNEKHGLAVGKGHAGDMPNLHVPANGELTIEIFNSAVTLESGKPNSVFHDGGTALVIHASKDDYRSDPAGEAGARIACGVISR